MSNLNENLPTVGVTADSSNSGSKEQHNDVITLNDVTNDNTCMNEINETIVTSTSRPTTPIPMRKLSSSKHPNLSLKIVTTAEETTHPSNSKNINTVASNSNILTSSTSSSSAAAAIKSARAAATVSSHEQSKVSKKLDIGFSNITYNVKTGFFKREIKNILNGLTGQFRAGELSAIVGPSGAGKSSLLNILSSYKPYGFSGDITVNGNMRDIKTFKPNVAFIMQDTSLQPFLTVDEAMHFSANLKIGPLMNHNEKNARVRKILEAIGMYENRHTKTGNLSGGQKKRLAIALELVTNPPVLILDEPTSGLDSSISNQCISLLKKMAMEGRTIICTIHQPSALTFKMFDHLYAIAEGQCIYSGGTQKLVPFLAEAGLECPESYNPADYLMEIATDDYGKQNHKLVLKIENGRNDTYRQGKSAQKAQVEALTEINKMMDAGLMTPVTAPALSASPLIFPQQPPNFSQSKSYQNFKPLTPIEEISPHVWDSRGILSDNELYTKEQQLQQPASKTAKKPKIQIDPTKLCQSDSIYATPFYQQLYILLVRTFLILWRDSSLTTLRFVIHLVTGLLIGFLYYNIGNDAGNALNNFRYVFYTIMFIMYCAFSSIIVKFPLEFPIVSREHFNRWYSLRAYYVAMTLADIPIQIICTSLFIITTYVLTGQPWELYRLALFSFMVFLTALVAQSIGLIVGASLSVQFGAILGPFFICPFLTFSGFFLQHKDAPIYLKWMFHVSFLRYSLDGAMLSLFGYDRPRLVCKDLYCHYSHPEFFLKDLDMTHANYEIATIFLVVLFLTLRILAFYIISFRLRIFR